MVSRRVQGDYEGLREDIDECFAKGRAGLHEGVALVYSGVRKSYRPRRRRMNRGRREEWVKLAHREIKKLGIADTGRGSDLLPLVRLYRPLLPNSTYSRLVTLYEGAIRENWAVDQLRSEIARCGGYVKVAGAMEAAKKKRTRYVSPAGPVKRRRVKS